MQYNVAREEIMVKINLDPIENFIAEKNWTYTVFCCYCNISMGTLRKIRKGQYVSFSMALRIALNMRYPLSELIEDMQDE